MKCEIINLLPDHLPVDKCLKLKTTIFYGKRSSARFSEERMVIVGKIS